MNSEKHGINMRLKNMADLIEFERERGRERQRQRRRQRQRVLKEFQRVLSKI